MGERSPARLEEGEGALPTEGRPSRPVESGREEERRPKPVRHRLRAASAKRSLAHRLARLRQEAGLTQAKMAKILGVGQSTISKLEGGRDTDLTLGQLKAYAKTTGHAFELHIGSRLTPFEGLQRHALRMKEHLERLARLANKEQELEKPIRDFFGEAFFALLRILSECETETPGAWAKTKCGKGEIELRVDPATLRADGSPDKATA